MLDYATVAAFLNAPMVFGFHGIPAAIVYWMAGIHLLMTGCTDFPLGVFKWIPFRIHGVIELLACWSSLLSRITLSASKSHRRIRTTGAVGEGQARGTRLRLRCEEFLSLRERRRRRRGSPPAVRA